jgi:hypothetical protein
LLESHTLQKIHRTSESWKFRFRRESAKFTCKIHDIAKVFAKRMIQNKLLAPTQSGNRPTFRNAQLEF